MVTNATTTNRTYKKPATGNTVAEDFSRLIDAMDAIDTDVAALLTSVSQRALLSHEHPMSEITGLASALANKSDVGHSHSLDDLTDVNAPSPSSGQFLRRVGSEWVPATLTSSMVGGLGTMAVQDASHYVPRVGGEVGAVLVPRGSTAERPAANSAIALFRYNTSISQFEGWTGSAWAPVAINAAPLLHDHAISNVTGLETALNTALVRGYRNRVVNGDFQIRQETHIASPVVVASGGAYVLDQWRAVLSASPGGALSCERVTIADGRCRLRATVSTPDTSLAAGDVYTIDQLIEGAELADARWNDSPKFQLLLTCVVNVSVPGTYSVSVSNADASYSWLGSITVPSGQQGVDIPVFLIITGPPSGSVWDVANGTGLRLRFCLAAGSTFVGSAGWQVANVTAVAGQTNLMATNGATFEIGDVGLYVDTLGLSIAPPFHPEPIAVNRMRCMRFYQLATKSALGAAGGVIDAYRFPVPMRATPDRSLVTAGTVFSASIVSEASDLTATGFYFQISSTAANGSVIGRVDAFSARLT